MSHEVSETVRAGNGFFYVISGRTKQVLEGPFQTQETADNVARLRSRRTNPFVLRLLGLFSDKPPDSILGRASLKDALDSNE